MTSLTELRIMVPFDKQGESLEALSQLQNLTIDYETRRWQPRGTVYYPLVVPEAAKITKLEWTVMRQVGKITMLVGILPNHGYMIYSPHSLWHVGSWGAAGYRSSLGLRC